MNAYELMINTNRRLILGEILTDSEKADIARKLLAAAEIPEKPVRQYGTESNSKARGTLYFSPARNDGKKLKTVLGQTPKTNILNDNMYELEILRLLCLFAPGNPIIAEMTAQTLNRLKATCFGYHGCSLGECFDSALVVLRFLTVAASSEAKWMKKIVDVYIRNHANKKRVKAVEWYYWLCLTELPPAFNTNEIENYESQIIAWQTIKPRFK